MPEWMNELTAEIFQRNVADRKRARTDPGFVFTQAMEDRRVLLELLDNRGTNSDIERLSAGA
jgi:hypothetical protein